MLADNLDINTQYGPQEPLLTTEAQDREFREWWGDPDAARPNSYTNQPTQSSYITRSGAAGPLNV